MGAECTDTRRYTEKWLLTCCNLISQALFGGFCTYRRLQFSSTSTVQCHVLTPGHDWSALTQLYNPMPTLTPTIQNKI